MNETTTTRTDHLAWCKARALAYLPADPPGALASMFSDLRKHPETTDHSGILLGPMLMFAGMLSTEADVRKFIEGFN